ncbi:hypothetical protein CF392_00250 [Tamilnaduibacter salinus]|uniref:Uncharacterized protein n=1 Tax=Tamilnaduibacter salinus TaxID=1484056 RepID=A0A2A2I696_9GAMM|nr:hypothetical protein [Tamilnaduibacter salinus]PAV27531.1 hypothetical protein CF392_00250 [Tamilnaduibacter salinus]
MSLKLSRLKQWLTLEDSAKYLSLAIDEDVAAADLLQLALQGDLTLSINLVNSHYARTGLKVPIREAQISKTSIEGQTATGKPPAIHVEELQGEEKDAFLDALIETKAKSHFKAPDASGEHGEIREQMALATTTPLPQSHSFVDFKGDLLPDYSGVLEFDRDSVQQITGVWDLPMVGSESLEIKGAFYDDIEGPDLDWVKLCGVILKHPTANRWANLIERFDDTRKEVEPKNFHPSGSLPEREPLIIRRDELQRFVASLEDSSDNAAPASPDDMPEDVDLLMAAWKAHWKGRVSERDRTTWPLHSNVKQWLIERGMSDRLAGAGATMITPDWARKGGRR